MASEKPRPQAEAEEASRQLLARLHAGDEGAATMLHARYHDALLRFCAGYLGSLDDAEDAVQEVFYKTIRSGQVPDNFRAWLYRVARNHCLNVLRARGRRGDGGTMPSASGLADSTTVIPLKLVKRELVSSIAKLVQELPAEQREVLWLRYSEGLSRAEIAAILEIPESFVKSRLFEGLKKLRGLLADVEEGG